VENVAVSISPRACRAGESHAGSPRFDVASPRSREDDDPWGKGRPVCTTRARMTDRSQAFELSDVGMHHARADDGCLVTNVRHSHARAADGPYTRRPAPVPRHSRARAPKAYRSAGIQHQTPAARPASSCTPAAGWRGRALRRQAGGVRYSGRKADEILHSCRKARRDLALRPQGLRGSALRRDRAARHAPASSTQGCTRWRWQPALRAFSAQVENRSSVENATKPRIWSAFAP
jgi:hypothetical protein